MSKKLALGLFLIFSLGIFVFPLLKNKSKAVAQTSIDPTRIRINSSYYGTVVSWDRYSYAPSIMLDDDGVYKMWWCGPDDKGRTRDHIHYATSADGLRWENHKILFGAGRGDEGDHVCDPSVLKVKGKYYIYYTSDSPDRHSKDNSIFMAISDDGLRWDKKGKVIECSKKDGSYCVGQSSVHFKDGKFWHYYSNTRGPSGNDWNVYLKSSLDGRNFVDENNGERVFGPGYGKNSVDIKYSATLGLYFMVHGEINDSKIYWNVSTNGINWLPYDPNRTIETEAPRSNDNPGILGTPLGQLLGDKTIAYYGARYGAGAAKIDATKIRLLVPVTRCQSSADDFLADFDSGIDPRWQVKCFVDESYTAPTIKYYQDRNFWDVNDDGDEKQGYCDVWLDLGGENWSSCQKFVIDWAASDNPNGARVRAWLMNNGQWNQNSLTTFTTEGTGFQRQKEVILDLSQQARDKVDRLMFRVKEQWIPPGAAQRTALYNLSLSQCSTLDLNQDCLLDSQDLKILLENWGDNPLEPRADLNGDGQVNGLDFSRLVVILLKK